MSKASDYQPDPLPGKNYVIDAVMKDFAERAESGRAKYGTYLQSGNGRDALWDAYQEAIDLAMYLRQAIMNATNATPPKDHRCRSLNC